jgi:RNA polymerase sigma-70 factor (ECF subfamily)
VAEEAAQEAFAVAAQRWPRDGVPSNPGAWLTVKAEYERALELTRSEPERRFLERRVAEASRSR